MAAKEGKITTLIEPKKLPKEQERLHTPLVAAKSWRAIKLHHDGREIRPRDRRDFGGHYVLFRSSVEDCNKGDEQSRPLSLLPDAWVKRVTKEEAKRAKRNRAGKMMPNKGQHKKVVILTRAKVAPECKRQSLRDALLITVSGDREKAAVWRLDEGEVAGQTIFL